MEPGSQRWRWHQPRGRRGLVEFLCTELMGLCERKQIKLRDLMQPLCGDPRIHSELAIITWYILMIGYVGDYFLVIFFFHLHLS